MYLWWKTLIVFEEIKKCFAIYFIIHWLNQNVSILCLESGVKVSMISKRNQYESLGFLHGHFLEGEVESSKTN